MLKVLVVNVKGGCGKTTIATTIASALANKGMTTALADADRQRSSLDWVQARPADAAFVTALDWTKDKWIGDTPKKLSALVIDAPGSLKGGKLDDLVGEATTIFVPVLPSAFDIQATKGFLDQIEEIKRIRKGKARLHLVANRVRPRARASQGLDQFFEKTKQAPLAAIPDRSAYVDLAMEGLSVFDKPQKVYEPLRVAFSPLLQVVEERA